MRPTNLLLLSIFGGQTKRDLKLFGLQDTCIHNNTISKKLSPSCIYIEEDDPMISVSWILRFACMHLNAIQFAVDQLNIGLTSFCKELYI